ncbi:hypothetical protein ABZV61_27830 [Streptomyces sp900116325]|uniref:Uncharacterized protein n=1 Tax=Streptomyces sp. 900116325 TaxID=3154295 RepID=A0ABV2UF99_9ACTN
MNIRLHFRLFATTAGIGLVLTACGSSGSPPGASGAPSAAPGTSAPSRSATVSVPPSPSAITPPGTQAPTTPAPGGSTPPLGSGRFQPMWPFTTLAEARAWERDFHSAGHQPWHLDPDQTALSFTQGYLGFREIGRVTAHTVKGRDARIGVGLSRPAGVTGPAALIHLVRYGTGPDAPWEVVGTDDTTFSLTVPGYGSIVRSPLLTGGRITGVDEGIRIQVRQPSSAAPLGTSCCTPAGGNDRHWKESAPFSGAEDPVLTIVASTGGHIAEVERFTVTAVRTG